MLRYENLGFKFKDRWIFKGLSGELVPGELVGIFGRNGSGKSTFLKCLAALLNPTEGAMFWNQISVADVSLKQLSEIRSYMTIETHCVWDMTLEEILLFYQRKSPVYQGHILKELGCDFPLKKKFLSLSSGEKSLFLLGLTLGEDRPLVLLDEITAFLDEQRTHHVLSILRRKAEEGRGIVLVLHDRPMAERYCHRLLSFYTNSHF